MKNTSKKNYQAYKRKAYKKKKYKNTSILSHKNSISFPFPSSVMIKFRTAVLINFSQIAATAPDLGSGNPSNQVFKLNSIVNVGAASSHPLSDGLSNFTANCPAGLYNLWSQSLGVTTGSTAIYQRFFVRKSKIIVEACTEGTSNKTLTVTIVPLTDNFSSVAALTNLLNEQPYAKEFMLPPVLNERPKKFSHEITTKKLFGLTSLDNSETDYCGDANGNSGNPETMGVWVVRIANADGLADNAYNGTMKVTLEHDTLLFDRNIINSLLPSVVP